MHIGVLRNFQNILRIHIKSSQNCYFIMFLIPILTVFVRYSDTFDTQSPEAPHWTIFVKMKHIWTILCYSFLKPKNEILCWRLRLFSFCLRVRCLCVRFQVLWRHPLTQFHDSMPKWLNRRYLQLELKVKHLCRCVCGCVYFYVNVFAYVFIACTWQSAVCRERQRAIPTIPKPFLYVN